MLDSLTERHYNQGMMNKETQMNATSLDQALLVADLAYIVARLPKRDNIFVGSLIRCFDATGRLSAPQEAVARSILVRNQELLNA